MPSPQISLMVSTGRCAHISDGNVPWGISQTSLILDPLLSENTLGFTFQGTHLGECWFREWFPYKSGFLRKPPQIRNTRINQTNHPLSLSLNMVTELHRNSCGSTPGWGHKVQGARRPGLGGPAGLWITVLPWCMPESWEFQPRRLTFFKMKLFRALHRLQKVHSGEHTTVTKDQGVMFSATALFPIAGWNEQLLSSILLGNILPQS